MTNIHIVFGLLATILTIIQAVPYIRSILGGETKPSRSSYTIWLANESVLVLGLLASGATTTMGLYFILFINSVVIFLLSLKYGVGGLKPMDLTCMGIATFAIIIWITTNNPALAVYSCLISSIIGYLPTISKCFKQPETENKLSWGIYVGAALMNVFAINKMEMVIILPPVLSFTMSAIVLALLMRKKYFGRLKAGKPHPEQLTNPALRSQLQI